MTPPKRPRTLAARLLEDVLRTSAWGMDTLARSLDLTVRELEDHRRDEPRMPVEHQLALATFVLGRIPECARLARRLIGQANAEAAFLAKETTTHMTAPPSQFWR